MRAGREMDKVADPAIVVDRSTSVDNDMLPKHGLWLNHRAGTNHGALANLRAFVDKGPRMDHDDPFQIEFACQIAAHGIVTYRDDGCDPSPLGNLRHGPDDRHSGHAAASFLG